MAEIAVEKKGGTPWWVWLLGALLLLGLLALLLRGCNDSGANTNANNANANARGANTSNVNTSNVNTTATPAGAATNTTNGNTANTANMANSANIANTANMANTANTANTNAAAATAGNFITDPRVYAATQNKSSLANREAQFTNARVVRVVGPRTFTVETGGEEMYVMLDEALPAGVGTQGRINPGDTISIGGRFEPLRAEEVANLSNNRFRPLTDLERATLRDREIYLHARQVALVR